MSTVITIIAAIAIFCILILSHEFGHFIVAKACGVFVEDFSLGMGPKLFSFRGKETQYTLRLLPIGGWCKMLGEDEDDDDPRAFCSRPVWQRICVIAAGPVANFIFAILIFIVAFMMLAPIEGENVVQSLVAGGPAEQAGMEIGDRVLSVNGEEIPRGVGIRQVIAKQPEGQPLQIQVQREEETLTFFITPEYNDSEQAWLIGISAISQQRVGVFTAAWMGIQQSVYLVKNILSAFIGMIAGTTPVEVSGPVGIVTFISQTTAYGLQSVLLFTGYLCVNLGLINLFPLPALDGSRIVFLIIEGLRGKPLNREKEGMVHFIGLILLFGLMLVLTYGDIMRLIRG